MFCVQRDRIHIERKMMEDKLREMGMDPESLKQKKEEQAKKREEEEERERKAIAEAEKEAGQNGGQ
jgi:hypothetical protein